MLFDFKNRKYALEMVLHELICTNYLGIKILRLLKNDLKMYDSVSKASVLYGIDFCIQ